MRSWQRPGIPTLPGKGQLPIVFDTARGSLVEAGSGNAARIYVCGITPYDATHLGHANTYLAFDTLIRLWLDAGVSVNYVQNVTDIDDPLLERAAATGVDWRELSESQIELFRGDMENLRIIPPDAYIGVTELIEPVADAVAALLSKGSAYRLATDEHVADVYFDSTFRNDAWHLGSESGLDLETMLILSAERGGDPERAGKRNPLDPLLWRGEREGEPAWDSPVGRGRPGWHIECSVIATTFADQPMTVNGGGADLVFPHHEFSAGHTAALTGHPLADSFVHSGMVAYEGAKMSKSLGNLMLVSNLVKHGADPRAVRLALLGQHYRSDWEWTDELLTEAERRLTRWSAKATGDGSLLQPLRDALHNDLDTPAALTVVDAATSLSVADRDAIEALLGIDL